VHQRFCKCSTALGYGTDSSQLSRNPCLGVAQAAMKDDPGRPLPIARDDRQWPTYVVRAEAWIGFSIGTPPASSRAERSAAPT